VWNTTTPGEKPSDHFMPVDAVNASGFVMFSIRTVNLVGTLSAPEAIPATLKIKPADTLNSFVSFFYLLFYFGAELSPPDLIGLDAPTLVKDAVELVSVPPV
jgi:hypothetical protein